MAKKKLLKPKKTDMEQLPMFKDHPERDIQSPGENAYLADIPVKEIRVSEQLRKEYHDEGIRELSESIRQQGLLQPVHVRKEEDGYRLVYGHRRFLAVKKLGCETIKALVEEVTEEDILARQIVENIQREDLHPLDVAEGLNQLMELTGIKQVELAKYVGKSKSYISDHLSILKLSKKVLPVELLRSVPDRNLLSKLSRIADDDLLNQSLQMIEEGRKRREIDKALSGKNSPEKEKKLVEEPPPPEIDPTTASFETIIEQFKLDVLSVMSLQPCSRNDLDWAAAQLEEKMEDIRLIVDALAELYPRGVPNEESTLTRQQKIEMACEEPALRFPCTATFVNIPEKLHEIGYVFMNYPENIEDPDPAKEIYKSMDTSVSLLDKDEIIEFIREKLGPVDWQVLHESAIEDLIEYWNALPFMKIDRSLDGFFAECLLKRPETPDEYLELECKSLGREDDPNSWWAKQTREVFKDI